VYTVNPVDGPTPAHQLLLAILQDPRIKRFALRYAGHLEIAEDALQSTYYAMARLKNLEQIDNLRAYVCKVLIHEVYRERGQLGAALVEDFASVAETCQDAVGSAPSTQDLACNSLQAQAWLQRLADKRDHLVAAVPARSHDPSRYRAVIYAVAEQLLRDAINAETSEADANHAFQAAWLEYFGPAGAAANTCHQRFRRARTDVWAMLRAVVPRDELT
jgi:DNA-directed RNA polymerase specialized sigma24 family protein